MPKFDCKFESQFRQEIMTFKSSDQFRSLNELCGIDFSSNDYLGLSQDQQIREALINFLAGANRLSSTGSRLISGHNSHVAEVESYLASTFGSDASLIFGSGYLASLGVCAALDHASAEFFSDALIHASWIDGMRLARAKTSIVPHLDLQRLEDALAHSKAERKVIFTESIFSMDGDIAPVAEIAALTNKYGAYCVIDEAHATGVLGTCGLGSAQDMVSHVERDRGIFIHTAGKALGAYGAFVCCSADFKTLMINKARSQIFSTALAPLAVEHIRLAVERMTNNSAFVLSLRHKIKIAQNSFLEYGISTSGTQINPILCGSNRVAVRAAESLKLRGFAVKAIRFPTVPIGAERIRICLNAQRSTQEIERLTQAVHDVLSERNHENICFGN